MTYLINDALPFQNVSFISGLGPAYKSESLNGMLCQNMWYICIYHSSCCIEIGLGSLPLYIQGSQTTSQIKTVVTLWFQSSLQNAALSDFFTGLPGVYVKAARWMLNFSFREWWICLCLVTWYKSSAVLIRPFRCGVREASIWFACLEPGDILPRRSELYTANERPRLLELTLLRLPQVSEGIDKLWIFKRWCER